VSSGAAVPLVLISGNDMKVHAVNANTGAGVWTYTSNITLTGTSVAFADGRVFTRNFGGAVALDVNSGAVLWTQAAVGLPTKTPAIAGRVVFYSDGATVFGLETATAAPIWKAPIPGGTSAGADMAIALEILIVPNRGHVYAFQ
jgi:outer membrane protein assembly factor BamB